MSDYYCTKCGVRTSMYGHDCIKEQEAMVELTVDSITEAIEKVKAIEAGHLQAMIPRLMGTPVLENPQLTGTQIMLMVSPEVMKFLKQHYAKQSNNLWEHSPFNFDGA